MDHWWIENNKETLTTNRDLALSECEKWKAMEEKTCRCHVIAENLRPALNVLSGDPDSPRVDLPSLILQAGHDRSLHTAIFSSNGYQVAGDDERGLSASPLNHNLGVSKQEVIVTNAEGTIIVWDGNTGRELRRLRNGARVMSISVDKTGEKLLSKDVNRTAQLWNLSTGQLLRKFDDADGAVSISPNGRLALIGGDFDQLGRLGKPKPTNTRLYDIESGRIEWMLDIMGLLWTVKFSNDGTKILTTEWNSFVTVWDIDRKSIRFRKYLPHIRTVEQWNFRQMDAKFLRTDGILFKFIR